MKEWKYTITIPIWVLPASVLGLMIAYAIFRSLR